MKIGIIGSGDVGVTLANGFAQLGDEVMLGTNSPEKKESLTERLDAGVKIGNFDAASEHGELIVFCVRGAVAADLIGELHRNLDGKIVIDTTNPISESQPTDGVLEFFNDYRESLFEKLVSAAPKAKLVKAFNSVSASVMVKPDFGETPTMFICGNDSSAKKSVAEILQRFGWDVADMGKAAAARAIEPLTLLFCIDGFNKNDWYHAFKYLKK